LARTVSAALPVVLLPPKEELVPLAATGVSMVIAPDGDATGNTLHDNLP
jgi:hypothetical protein